jgi:hypothetical protein
MKGGKKLGICPVLQDRFPLHKNLSVPEGLQKKKICDNSIQFNPFHFGYSLNELKRKGAREILLSPNPLIGYI